MTNDDHLLIHVLDTGMGIPEDKQQELFDPFNRLGMENTGIEGTGIGLTICKILMEAREGEITIKSIPGKSSQFTLKIPLGQKIPTQILKEKTKIMNDPIKNNNTEMRTVLYVEDNQANLILVEQIMAKRKDIQLITATNADKGIELAKTERPDLILMDINLPGMSGVEAFELLRDCPDTCQIPIIAVSANAMQSDIDRALEIGFAAYVTKPIQIKKFLDIINNIITPDMVIKA
jgi:CheY-like chemotaxis protein